MKMSLMKPGTYPIVATSEANGNQPRFQANLTRRITPPAQFTNTDARKPRAARPSDVEPRTVRSARGETLANDSAHPRFSPSSCVASCGHVLFAPDRRPRQWRQAGLRRVHGRRL